eukprot:jgi/Chrzof1/651/Cz01g23240.t1
MHQLRIITCLMMVVCACGLLHDKSRGFQAVKADAEDMEVFLDQHSPQRQQYNIKVTADLKEHPDFKRFEEWRAQHKAGDLLAGAAFAGPIPHELIHHLSYHDEHHGGHEEHHHHHHDHDHQHHEMEPAHADHQQHDGHDHNHRGHHDQHDDI